MPKDESSYKRQRITVYDDTTGDILYDIDRPAYKSNGSGFVISYTSHTCEFLEKVQQGSVVRIFFYIAHHQNYGTDNVYGFRCSRSYFAKVLRLTRKTVYSALEFLKKHHYIVENRINGSLEFMVNPNIVTIGSDKKARVREFQRRVEDMLLSKLDGVVSRRPDPAPNSANDADDDVVSENDDLDDDDADT